jgi:predicted transcriptional regulator
MNQLPLHFDICRNRHGGADTSMEAWESIANCAGKIRKRVFDFIQEQGRASCEEIEISLCLSHQTASARLSELKRDGFIKICTQRARTRSGRSARIYEAA